MLSPCRFGATYVGSKMFSPSEAYPLLLGDIDPSGNLNASVVHAPTERLRTKFVAQIQERKWQSVQLTADYKADLYTASLTLGNPDLFSGTGVALFHYLRSVTKELALGAEFVYQASPQIPGGHIGVLSVCGRYQNDDCALTGKIGNSGHLHTTFYQKCSDNLQVGVEMETNFKMEVRTALISFSWDISMSLFVGFLGEDF